MPDVTTELVVETAPPAETVSPPTTETPTEPPSTEPHTLEPGGDRFKQVWARAKSAEADKERLAAELQQERESRIRYEERLKAQETKPTKTEPVYSWQQLEDMVTNGTLTRAQASEYREGVVKRDLKAEQDRELDQRLVNIERARRVTTDLDNYKRLIPAVMQAGTPEREKVAAEYRYMTGVLGMPEGVATELAASRAAFGDLAALERSRAASNSTRDNREATVETTTSGHAPEAKKDPLKGLDTRQREHYERMIKKGRYPKGWDDVRTELTWTRGQTKPTKPT